MVLVYEFITYFVMLCACGTFAIKLRHATPLLSRFEVGLVEVWPGIMAQSCQSPVH